MLAAKAFIAEHASERLAVGDRLAPRTEVWPDAERFPTAPVGKAETAPDVVEDEGCVVFVAGAADVAGEGGVDEFLIVAGVVAERGDDDGGEIVPRRFDCRSKRLDVVVPELDEMGTVLRYHPGESRCNTMGQRHGRHP